MSPGWIREPAVAGTFYSANPTTLLRELEGYFQNREPDPATVAVMAPHAGYRYSGRIAAEVYRRLSPPKRAIILAPNHTGHGKRVSVWPRGAWRTPLGEAKIDEESAAWLLEKLGDSGDREAHRFEHAAEVHVPFLQFLNPDVEILPIVLSTLSPEYCQQLGTWLVELTRERPALVIASTDMSHYIPANEAKRLDEMALDRVEEIDGAGLYKVVRQKGISMCGFVPTTCLLDALSTLKEAHAEILAYGHSGEITGDLTEVVGYAGARFLLPFS